MRAQDSRIILLCAALSLLAIIFSIDARSANINATIKIGICGDGFVDTNEQCDGAAFNGAMCSTVGFASGTLSCTPSCEFDTSACIAAPPSGGNTGGGGGGGGGGGSPNTAPTTGVVIRGRAYPLSRVSVLKDGQLSVTTIAGPDSNFSVTLSGLSAGAYSFSVYGEDNNNIRSSLFTFPVFVSSGATTEIGGIFIAPTISVDKSEVKQGDNIAIFGQSAPSSEVTVSVNSAHEFLLRKTSDSNGVYLVNFDTSVLELGQHHTKSKSAIAGEISSFGKIVGFRVGDENVALQPVPSAASDLNGDERVNIVDFSIAAYWYKRANPPAEIDLNNDKKVDLVDFSIMAFNWTG